MIQPIPPPSVSPATPVCVTIPDGTASPNACVSRSSSPSSTPAWARAIRALGIDADALHRREVDHQRVVARPSSRGSEWPPLRIATGTPLARAALTAAITSATPAQRAIAAGRRSIEPFQIRRCSSKPGVGRAEDLAAECCGVQLERVDGRAHAVSLARSAPELQSRFASLSSHLPDDERPELRLRLEADRRVERLGVVGLEPDVLARDRVDQQPQHLRGDPLPPVRRRRPDVDEVGVADAVGEQPRHPDDAVAVAGDRDVPGLLERAPERVGASGRCRSRRLPGRPWPAPSRCRRASRRSGRSRAHYRRHVPSELTGTPVRV